jgi:NitT/TauT family transport system substrate-binding protein
MIDRRRFIQSGIVAAASVHFRSVQAATVSVKIGQATASLGFLPVWIARAYDTFAQQNLDLTWAVINGGDPAALAALDSGDIDLAATGSDAVLDAVAKGLPYRIVYSLMSKASLNMTVSREFMRRTGASVDQPVDVRIGKLRNAVVGVTVVGGAQDRTVRWLVSKGGLDPKSDVKIVQIGSPTALGAALENSRIDAFMLSSPQGEIAEAGGYGTIYIRPDRDIPEMRGMPTLVLVARSDVDEVAGSKIVASCRALNAGSKAFLVDIDGGAERLRAKFFPKVAPEVMRRSIEDLVGGIKDNGSLNQHSADLLVKFVVESGRTPPAGPFWTNEYVERALGSSN